MARIRTIKPEFWSSGQVVECSPIARLLFVGMWNFADDAGVIPDSPKQLKMKIFPGDSINEEGMATLVAELVEHGLIERFSAENKAYLCVTGWHHQRIDKPSFKYPPPPKFGDHSTNGRRILVDRPPADRSGRDRSGKDRKGVEGSGASAIAESGTPPDSPELELERQFVESFNSTSGVAPNRGAQLSPKRRSTFRARCKDAGWLDDYPKALAKFPLGFTRGDPEPWRPDAEWFLKPDSVTRILEGKYDRKFETKSNGLHRNPQSDPSKIRSGEYERD